MKNPDRDQQERAAAVDVGELAEQRRRRGRGEQIGGDDPGQIVDVAKTLADRRQSRRDDGLFQRGEKHRQHDAGDDGADGGMIERRRPAHVRCRRGAAGPVQRRAAAPVRLAIGTTSGAMLCASSGAIWRVMDPAPLGPRGARIATAVFAGQTRGTRLTSPLACRAAFVNFSGQLTM